MTDPSERINAPISTSELERRWAAVRRAMDEQRIDVLLMQNNNDFMGGYVKYFTDVPATNGYPVTVVFPREDRMTVVAMGGFGMDKDLPPEGDGLRRGVKRVLGSPSFASAAYTKHYDAELAEKALEGYSGATIGLVGTSSIAYATVDYLMRGKLSNAKFVDVSDLVDRIKAVKSPEEIASMRRTAAMQDEAMARVFKAVKPGMKDIEVAALAEQAGHGMGSEQGLFLAASAPLNVGIAFGNRHVQNRTLRAGDQFTLLIENSGAGGFYTELGRSCVLGRATQEMKDEFAFVLEARKFTLDRLKPGASCKEIWEAYNDFMRRNKRPEEKRVHCHGMGYDMVERPLVRFDETMKVGKDMVFACHPTYVTERTYSWACDNFLVGSAGLPERLHKFPEILTELG